MGRCFSGLGHAPLAAEPVHSDVHYFWVLLHCTALSSEAAVVQMRLLKESPGDRSARAQLPSNYEQCDRSQEGSQASSQSTTTWVACSVGTDSERGLSDCFQPEQYGS